MKLPALFAAVATLTLAACTDFAEVSENSCGNLVVDETEDCDGYAPLGEAAACGEVDTANACHYICSAEATCPVGWGCGDDGRCRRASGHFTPATGSPWLFQVQDFAIGDVDGDDNLDIIGDSFSSIQVRFGSEDGELQSELKVVIREPTGTPSYGLFDDDERLDVVVPIAEGLFVMLGQGDRSLEPVAYSPFAIPAGEVQMVPVESGNNTLMTEVLLITANVMGFLNAGEPDILLPDGHSLEQLVGRVPVANLNSDDLLDEGRFEFALAFAGESVVYVYSSTGHSDGAVWTLEPDLIQEVALPLGAVVEHGAHFADADGDGDLDLMVSARSALNVERVAIARYDGGLLAPFANADWVGVFDRGQGSAWPLAAGLFDNDAKVDYVFPEQIVITDYGGGGTNMPSTFLPTAFITTAQWSEAVVGDFNGDSNADVAVVIEGVEGVDFFLNVGRTGFFNKFHIDTDSAPQYLRVADFDGDMVADVAFMENGRGARPDKLSLIFGSHSGGPSEPVTMGSMGFIKWLEPLSWVTTTEGIDAISDLIVISDSYPDGATSAVAIMQGSSSRRMLAPYTLQPPESDQPDIPRWAIFGNFGFDDDRIVDVVAVADASIRFDEDIITAPVILESHLWMIPGQDGRGQLDASGAKQVTLPDFVDFDTTCSVWTTGDIDRTGANDRDEIFGIDNDASCAAFADAGGLAPSRLVVGRLESGDGGPIIATVAEIPGDARAVGRVEMHDVDGDADLDLVALFVGDVYGATDDGTIAGAAIIVFWNQGGTISVADRTELALEDQAPLLDFAPIQSDGDTIPELLILTESGVFLTRLDVANASYGALTTLESVEFQGDGGIASGDLDSDGVEDFVFVGGGDAHVFLGKVAGPVGQNQDGEGEGE